MVQKQLKNWSSVEIVSEREALLACIFFGVIMKSTEQINREAEAVASTTQIMCFLWLFVVCLRFPVQRVKEHIKQGWSSLM